MLLEQVYRAFTRAVARMKEDPLGGRSSLPKYTPISAELAPRTAAYQPFTLDDQPDMATVQKLADIMLESKLLRRRMDVSAGFLTEKQLRP